MIKNDCDRNYDSYSDLGHTYACSYKYGSNEAQTRLAGTFFFKVDEIKVFELEEIKK
jgi:hypothetical protein